MRPVVVIADDSMVVRAFLRKQLSGEDYELLEADGGEATLQLCRTRRPNLVLLDVEMPGMTGYDVLTALKGDPELSSIPVIFLSGRVSASDVATGLRMGAQDYLRKPVETGELLARVAKVVEAGVHADPTPADVAAAPVDVAPIDAVTGVLDYPGLEAEVRRLTADPGAGRPLAGLIVDVHDLTGTNERHGHEVGDQVLRGVATVLRERVPSGAIVGRVGADEFLVLLPEGTEAQAAALEADVATTIAASPALGAGPLAVRIHTATAGATTDDLEGLFKSLEFQMALARTAQATAAAPAAPAVAAPAPAPPAARRPDLPPPPAPPRPGSTLPSWLEDSRAAAAGANSTAGAPRPTPPADPAATRPSPAQTSAPTPAAAPTPAEEAEPADDDAGDEQSGRFRRWIRPR